MITQWGLSSPVSSMLNDTSQYHHMRKSITTDGLPDQISLTFSQGKMKDTEPRSDFFRDFIFIVFSNYFEYKFVNVFFLFV